ncbi:G-protein alpha subunit-domain-containing protein [Russula brevipes]|nr:G-protein alpha subunit-domain-containing protein [Russula brevipes]
MRSRTSDDDPLDAVLRPPPDESPEAMAIRVAREEEALRVSRAIDESIRIERQTNKKNKIVRVLLLGQSESGAPHSSSVFVIRHRSPRPQASPQRSAVSAALPCTFAPACFSIISPEFQRIYTPTAFREERIHWRVIIQLNVIHSVHTILDALSAYHRRTSRSRAHTLYGARWDSRSQVTSVRPDGKGKGKARADTLSDYDDEEDELPGNAATHPLYADAFSDEDTRADAELDEIVQRLEPLRRVETMLKGRLVLPSEDEPADLGNGLASLPTTALGLAKEIFVRPGRWRSGGAGARPASAVAAEAADEAQQMLFECRFDLMRLWASMRVREILALRRLRPEEESGFVLTKIRFMRVSLDAIIFLAPISAFDQVLTEDPKVNRLEDSVLLWKGICQNKLLATVDLVLFLNKCDILQRKLESGIRLSRYVKSYDDRVNDVDTASKYFRGKFSAIQRTYSPVPRKFYGYCTSVTESATTAGILASVRDIVLRQNLRSVRLV